MLKRHYIDNTDGGQIHFVEAGTPSHVPTILLLHQTPRSWDEFREVMILLKEKRHLIAIDLPGMGASSSNGDKTSIQNYANAAVQVIHYLGSNAVTVCGHHTGGVVAIDLAAEHPNLIHSLILSSCPWVDKAERNARLNKTPIDTTERSRDGRHVLDLWQQRSQYYPDDLEYMDRFLSDALKADDPARGHVAVGRYAMETAALQIECPILIIEHSQDPFSTPHIKRLCAAFPQAKVNQILKGQIPLEATAPQFSELLYSWTEPARKFNNKRQLKAVK